MLSAILSAILSAAQRRRRMKSKDVVEARGPVATGPEGAYGYVIYRSSIIFVGLHPTITTNIHQMPSKHHHHVQ